jgi:hypothetical protein
MQDNTKNMRKLKIRWFNILKTKENEKAILSMGNDFVYYHFCMLSKH